MKQASFFALALCTLLGFVTTGRAAAPYVWLESENPSATSVPPVEEGVGHPEWLSGNQWLKINLDAERAEKELPATGVLLTYKLDLPAAATYQIWHRAGFEYVRSPFEWRLDGGDWTMVKPDDPQYQTVDLMELATWNEVGWFNMGERTLNTGAHTLEIRLPKTKNEKGETQRILYASDALLFYPGDFYPNGKYKPGESGRTARDEAATNHVFQLAPPAAAGARAAVKLGGMWEVTRHDEALPEGEVATPIEDFPAEPHWTAIQVPGDKNQREDLLLAHRLWYRTRVNVPAGLVGRSFYINFPQNTLNTTVVVNGVLCGFEKNPMVNFDIDITKGIKPGEVNEIRVGIRDAWYGYSTKAGDPMKLRRKFNIPLDFTGQGFQDLAYPVWKAMQSGILGTPTLVAAGPVYASDVFVKPSVANRQLATEVTLTNNRAQAAQGQIQWQALDVKTDAVAKTFAAKPFAVAAGQSQALEISDAWADPKLWWYDDPNLYRLRVAVTLDGQSVDISDTRFGFREWSIDGKDFKLNGVVWHGWAELPPGNTPQELVDWYRAHDQRFMRYAGNTQNGGPNWRGLEPPQALDFFDENGIVIRRSGVLDGEAIGYMAVEQDADLKAQYGSEIKMQLLNNWKDQMVAQVKGERNHPSIQIWSIENEFLYINAINLYGGLMDEFEAVITDVSNAVLAVDPTRATMVDGGGATKAQTLPVHGDHYVYDGGGNYPALAYEANPTGGGRGRWVWDEKRPRYLGEDFYASGINPADYAWIGGEATFQGKSAAAPAAAKVLNMLTQGYRWADYGAFHFWVGEDTLGPGWDKSNAPVAVFARQWNWSFGAGEKVPRRLAIFNDSHDNRPLTLVTHLMVAGKSVAREAKEYSVPAGTRRELDVTLALPAVNARTEAKWYLVLERGGQRIFEDVKEIAILPPLTLAATGPNSANVGTHSSASSQLVSAPAVTTTALAQVAPKAGGLLLFDPSGKVAAFLRQSGATFTTINSLEALPATGKVLIVGPDALDAQESTSTRLAAWAAPGRTVIVLEQKNPLKYQALPAAMDVTGDDGRIAFAEDLNHPALRGLEQQDFFTWGEGEWLYRDAYSKPSRGAKSLVQAHDRLRDTVLAEVPVGQGLLLLSQLTIGEHLADNAVPRHLLANLIAYGTSYELEFRPVAAYVAGNPLLQKALDAMGLEYSSAPGVLEAIGGAAKIAVIHASLQNLQTLAGNKAQVDAFTNGGGWIVLNGLTPDGLESYNRLVGYEHMIRPFRRERVGFALPRHPLLSGLSLGDVTLLSGEQIFGWVKDEYVVSDEFAYVVDYEDVAPFAQSESFLFENAVNNFFQADAWKLINNFPAGANGVSIPLTLPKPQRIKEFTWVGNTLYNAVTKVDLSIGGQTRSFTTAPNAEPQTFAIEPPLEGREITLRMVDWEHKPDKKNDQGEDLIGLDNFYLLAQRSPEFYEKVKPMLNVGGMMQYPRGPGGIVLNNVLFKDSEAVPVNVQKKRAMFAVVLRNLKAPFSGGKSIIAGAGLKYSPLDISKQANQFRNENGWFGDNNTTFAALPVGEQTFGEVLYDIYDFPTSPVPTAIMLGGAGVPNNLPEQVEGIPVNRKADALFFLQAARIDQPRNRDEIRDNKKFEMAKYFIHYADGQTAEVPIYAEIDVANYKQTEPQAIPGAQIAWTKPYAGTDQSAVAYSMQWTNPRPDVAITTVDLVYGADRRGVPALLALTAANA